MLKSKLLELHSALRLAGSTSPGRSDPAIVEHAEKMASDCYPLLLFIQWIEANSDAVRILDELGIGWNGLSAHPEACVPSLSLPAGQTGPDPARILSDVVTSGASTLAPFRAMLGNGQMATVRLLEVIGDNLKVQAVAANGVPARGPGCISIIRIEQVHVEDKPRVSGFVKMDAGSRIILESETEVARPTIGLSPEHPARLEQDSLPREDSFSLIERLRAAKKSQQDSKFE